MFWQSSLEDFCQKDQNTLLKNIASLEKLQNYFDSLATYLKENIGCGFVYNPDKNSYEREDSVPEESFFSENTFKKAELTLPNFYTLSPTELSLTKQERTFYCTGFMKTEMTAHEKIRFKQFLKK